MFTAVLFLLAITVPVTAPPPPPANDGFVLLADDWARPRTGASVVALPALRAAVDAWRRDERAASAAVSSASARISSEYAKPVRSPAIARTPTPCSMLCEPSRTRPSSSTQLSWRDDWK